MTLRQRLFAFTAMTMLAGTMALPVTGEAQGRFSNMSDQQLEQMLQQLQGGNSTLSEALTARRIQQIQRELAARRSGQQQQQQAQPQQQQQQPQVQQPADDGGNANQAARQYLRSTDNLGQLNDRQLGRAIQQGRELLQQGLRGNIQNRVQDRVQQAANERQRRQNATQQPQQPQQPQVQQPANDGGNANQAARQYLRSTDNLGQLNDRQLGRAIQQGQELLQQGLRGNIQNRVQERVQQAANERQRRQNAGQPQQPQQPQVQQPADDGGNANQAARQYLRSTDNLGQLNDRQLGRAIQQGRELLQQGLRGNIQNRVRERVQQAANERQRRQNAGQPQQPDNNAGAGGGNVNRQARQLLRDNRNASALDNRELRNRLELGRSLMGNRDLDRDLFRQIRRMARQDADELRTRVAQRSENREERREARQDARELLGDRRPASRLNDRQLQQRIISAQALLDARGLRPDVEQQVRNILREARREKRDRLIAGRSERRDRLRDRTTVIRIPTGRDFRARDDIAAAEADDELLQNQLTAPPTRRIERRYNRSEFRTNPRIRDFMPAIEVDTIRFGFNEAFVREEEIPQLERIGQIIERIVSANPDEVFLIEGHTDAVGSASYNLDLSTKRANAVREAMLQYFNIEAGNIETVGYGEEFLKIETDLEEPENRRVTIRRITPMLAGN